MVIASRPKGPAAIFSLTEAVAAARTVDEICEAAIVCLGEILAIERTAVLLFDEAGVMRFTAWSGLSDGYRAAVEGHSPWAPDTRDAAPVLVPEIAAEPALEHLRDVLDAEGIAAVAFVPLVLGGQLLGKFMLYYPAPHSFTNDEIEVARAVAAHVAFALDQDARREEQRHLSAMFDSALVGIAELDPAGHFLLVNDRYCEIVGRPREELLAGMDCIEITHTDDRAATEAYLRDLIAGGSSFTLEKRYLRPDGSEVWVSKSVSAIRGRRGLTGAVAFVTDVSERKAAEEAARQSERRSRDLLEALDLAVYTTDAEGRITFFNEPAAALWGREPEIGVDMWCGSWRIFNPDGSAVALEDCPMGVALKEQRPVRGEEIIVERPDGSRAWILPNPTPLYGADGQMSGAVNVLMDITNLKDTRAALDDRNSLIDLVNENMSVGLVMLDGSGRLEFMNPAAERLTGYTLDDLRGHRIHERLHYIRPDGTPYPVEECPLAVATSEGQTVTAHPDVFVRPDGRAYHVICNMAPIMVRGEKRGTILDVRDVTEQKRAIDALRVSEELFRRMADGAPVLVWLSDTEGRCTYVNQGWLDFTGKTFADEIGEGWSSSLHPDDREAFLATFHDAFRTRDRFLTEYRLRRADGTYHWVMDTGVPLHTAGGDFIGFVGAAVDVSERREAEEQMREAAALKDQFLGLVSHELRTPISTILGNGLLLLRNSNRLSTEDRETALTDVVSEARRLRDIIENLLLLTRLDAGDLDLEPISLQRLIEAEIQDFAKDHERQVVFDASGPVPPAVGSPTLMSIVLRNLISNAEKYSAAEHPVTVQVEDSGDGFAEMRVTDQGIGLDDADMAQLFTPFYRSRQARAQATGVGLGLAVCKSAVEAQGGSMMVRSEAGKGFDIHRPASAGRRPSGLMQEQRLPRVLVIDDDAALVRMIRLSCVAEGFDVTTAGDGIQGLEKLQERPVDVVVLDLQMPRMDGRTFFRTVRDRGERVPVIILSAYGAEEAAEELRAEASIQKPFDPEILVAQIRRLAAVSR